MLQFELVSPEKKLFSAEVALVTLPGTEGDFGVLPGHAPFISTLRVGIIDVYEKDAKDISRRILVSGGLAEAGPQRCTAMAEEAVPLEEVSAQTLADERRGLEERLSVVDTDEGRKRLQNLLLLTEKKLQVIAAIGHGK
jgi:F-type H+-transporting ATPase subunit epsilon